MTDTFTEAERNEFRRLAKLRREMETEGLIESRVNSLTGSIEYSNTRKGHNALIRRKVESLRKP